MKHIFAAITFLLVAFSASAQRFQLNISLSGDTAGVSKVLVQPLNAGSEAKPVALRHKNNAYAGSLRASELGLYSLIVVRNQSQLNVPFTLVSAEKAALDVKIEGALLFIDNTPDNAAFSALMADINSLDRSLWNHAALSPKDLKALVKGYVAAYDSISKLDGVTGHARDYMKVHAYARAYNAYSSIPRAQKISESAIPFSRSEVLPSPKDVFDNDYASLVYGVPQIIKSDFPASPSLYDKMAYLYSTYSSEAVREKVVVTLMSDFLSKYNYSDDFEGGLELIKSVTKEYSLPQVYVEAYMKRKSTIVGSPFPEDVELVDENGKKVDFSTFKGKYVYVDMWASWCNPCCKEVPHLQKLESELRNKDVVFVSISTDTDVKAWKNKMSELKMHGVQLLDSNNSLSNALNVKMIPFFAIYDKEGRLHTYGALRPSSGKKLKDVLEGLK